MAVSRNSSLHEIQAEIVSGNVADVRKLYSDLRSIANKRLQRLGEAGFESSAVYKKFSGEFIKLKDISNNAELAHRMDELNRFINNNLSSISGQRRYVNDMLDTLHDHGFDFVDKSNFKEFTDFMDAFREMGYDSIYDSERVLRDVFQKLPKGSNKDKIKKAFQQYAKKMQRGTSRAKMRRRKKGLG